MAKPSDVAWDIAASTGTCFLAAGKHQWPMSAIVRQDEEAIYFFTNAKHAKIGIIERDGTAQLTFSDHSNNRYLVVDGQATVSNDRAKIDELWGPFAKAWFDDSNNPDIRLIVFKPGAAEYWDGPNSLIAAARMLMASAVGGPPEMGENAKTTM